MPKKIRFPLKLADDTQVRTLEELREHFDLEAVLGYYKNGKLLTWLEDRYLEGEAEAIRALDESAPDFQRKLCEVFQVEYTGDDADMEAIQLRQERLAKLRTITDEPEFIAHIDQIAFDQEELADLLDEDETTIYLCGGKFTIPASRKGITYVGINTPAVHISGKVPETVDELGITFRECAVDNLPYTLKGNTAQTEISESVADTCIARLGKHRFCTFDSDLKFLETQDYLLCYQEEYDGDPLPKGFWCVDKKTGKFERLSDDIFEDEHLFIFFRFTAIHIQGNTIYWAVPPRFNFSSFSKNGHQFPSFYEKKSESPI